MSETKPPEEVTFESLKARIAQLEAERNAVYLEGYGIFGPSQVKNLIDKCDKFDSSHIELRRRIENIAEEVRVCLYENYKPYPSLVKVLALTRGV